MRTWQGIGISVVLGVAIGLGAAWASVAVGRSGLTLSKGAWTTSRSAGSVAADDRTRAIVAWRGLLALPRREALYYDSSVDSAGRPLDGKCRYRVAGGEMPVRWWSITAYDGAGFLLRTTPERPSVGSAALPPAMSGKWSITVAPKDPGDGSPWITTGGIAHFELTLRAYGPTEALQADPLAATLPTIVREAC